MVNLAQMADPFAHFGNRGCAVYAASFARIWEQQGKNGLRPPLAVAKIRLDS